MSTYATTSTLSGGITFAPNASPPPAALPKGLIVTRAVETKDGWVGQIIVAEQIVWESEPQKKAHKAEHLATQRVIDRIAALLTYERVVGTLPAEDPDRTKDLEGEDV